MRISNIKNNKGGFTLIETMVAVFILTIALTGLSALIASSLFSAQYSRNEITANYLLQEAVDYIRNDRDTTAFQQSAAGGGWDAFLIKYGRDIPGKCFSTDGCYFEPAIVPLSITQCSGSPSGTIDGCPVFRYDETSTKNDFYTYDGSLGIPSVFRRQVRMSLSPGKPDELDLKVTLQWRNGNISRSRSLQVSLLNWQK